MCIFLQKTRITLLLISIFQIIVWYWCCLSVNEFTPFTINTNRRIPCCEITKSKNQKKPHPQPLSRREGLFRCVLPMSVCRASGRGEDARQVFLSGNTFPRKNSWVESYSALSTYILTWEFFNVFVIFNYRRQRKLPSMGRKFTKYFVFMSVTCLYVLIIFGHLRLEVSTLTKIINICV